MERFHSIIIGGMQVHHPCVGHIKARVFIQLPERYRAAATLVGSCQAAFRELGIPEDETYELSYNDAKGALEIYQPVDRDGITDRI